MRRACLPFLSLPLSPHLSSDGGNHDISQEYSPFFQGFFFSMLAKYSQKQLGNPRKTSGQPVAGKGGREGWGFRKMDRDFKFKPEHVTHMRKKTREKVGASSKYVYA